MTLLSRAGALLRARLIDDVHRAWRFLSVQVAAAGVVIELLLQTGIADQFLSPAAARWTTVGLFCAVIVGRLFLQGERADG